MLLAEKVNPIAILKTCATTKVVAAKKTCNPNKSGAAKTNVNSIGSVIPVKKLVNAPESKRLPTTFLDSGLAQ